jgi:Family of unknown function (DUF6088)
MRSQALTGFRWRFWIQRRMENLRVKGLPKGPKLLLHFVREQPMSSDRKRNASMTSIAKAILKEAKGLPEGTILTAKGLLHLGNRPAVDQALARLVQNGQLMRAIYGKYVLPIEGRFGVRPPSASKVAEQLSRATGEIVAVHGGAAANSLGLTTQVPIREMYVTSGSNKILNLGNQVIEVRHAPAWQLKMAGRPAGEAIRAMAWMGKEHAGETLSKLKERLPTMEWQALTSLRSEVPSWMAKAISEAMNHA